MIDLGHMIDLKRITFLLSHSAFFLPGVDFVRSIYDASFKMMNLGHLIDLKRMNHWYKIGDLFEMDDLFGMGDLFEMGDAEII